MEVRDVTLGAKKTFSGNLSTKIITPSNALTYSPSKEQKTNISSDISANGANYVVAIDGDFTLIYGTSASCPTVAGLITLINEKRMTAGKNSVGFINPTLYGNTAMFNDIKKGGNQGCGTAGFTAVEGSCSFFLCFCFL